MAPRKNKIGDPSWDYPHGSRAHPRYPLILLLNRDELYSRPTEAVAWWEWGSQRILGGRDVKAGGTWMGCTRDGKLAFLTNVLEPDTLPIARSRGDLPVRFLESGKSPLEFAQEVALEADQYNGFNLVLADLRARTMVYVSNRPKGHPATVQAVAPGLHVLTNAQLDTPWPKAQRLAKGFRDLLYSFPDGGSDELPVRPMMELMGDRVRPAKDKIPRTGCNPDFELKISSIFVGAEMVEQGSFGTRSQAAVTMRCNGEVAFYERYLDGGSKWKEHTLEYIIDKA